ncbi:MAG TPA: hypothetical protein VMV56_05790 [Williamwhitmania sp.]|nr:hypothetical protein [Williamwhitmania sp.]
MKKVTVSIMVALMLLAVAPLPVNAATKAPTTLVAEPAVANTAENDALLLRLNEIKSMDKSTLSSSEKKGLRKEVKSIRSELMRNGGGIYISGAGAIIIILLLIILL